MTTLRRGMRVVALTLPFALYFFGRHYLEKIRLSYEAICGGRADLQLGSADQVFSPLGVLGGFVIATAVLSGVVITLLSQTEGVRRG